MCTDVFFLNNQFVSISFTVKMTYPWLLTNVVNVLRDILWYQNNT